MSMSNAFRQARDTRLNRQQRLDEEFGRVAEAYARKQEYDEQKQREERRYKIGYLEKQLQDGQTWLTTPKTERALMENEYKKLYAEEGIQNVNVQNLGVPTVENIIAEQRRLNPNITPMQLYSVVRRIPNWETELKESFIPLEIREAKKLEHQTKQEAYNASRNGEPGKPADPNAPVTEPRKMSDEELEASILMPDYSPTKEATVANTFLKAIDSDPQNAFSTASTYGGVYPDAVDKWKGATFARLGITREPGETDDQMAARAQIAYTAENMRQQRQAQIALQKEGERSYAAMIAVLANPKSGDAERFAAVNSLYPADSQPALHAQYMNMSPEDAFALSPGRQKVATINQGARRITETERANKAGEGIKRMLADSTVRYQTSMANTAGENAKTSRFRANAWAAHLKIQEATAESKGKQITPQASASMMSQVRQTSKRLTEISELLAYGGYDVDGKLEPFDDEMIQALKDEQFVLTNTQNKALDIMGSGSGSVTGTTKTPSGKWLKTEFRPETQHIIARGIRIAIANGENETWEHFLAGSPKKWRGKDGKGTELRKIWDDVHQKG